VHRTRPKSSTWERHSQVRKCAAGRDLQVLYFRAKRSVTVMPISQRLHWLQTKDMEERSESVSRFRESTMSLGQVIGEVYTSRDAHWSAPGPATPDKKTAAPTAASPVSPAKVPPSTSPFKLGKSINGKQVATAMKDGTKLCSQFQRGGCKAKPCPQEAHRCAAVLRKDRVWGLQSRCHELHQQALTNPRGGGGCLFWVGWVRAARGATSYGRPYGGPQRPTYQSLHHAVVDGVA